MSACVPFSWNNQINEPTLTIRLLLWNMIWPVMLILWLLYISVWLHLRCKMLLLKEHRKTHSRTTCETNLDLSRSPCFSDKAISWHLTYICFEKENLEFEWITEWCNKYHLEFELEFLIQRFTLLKFVIRMFSCMTLFKGWRVAELELFLKAVKNLTQKKP